jgi:hypothetical protein
MKESLLEHIEAKVINFLHDMQAPHHASQIAVHIHETRGDTLQAIQRLLKNQIIKGVQDFTLLNSTGETMAYTLAGTPPGPATIMPPVPSRPASSLPRGSVRGG